MLIGVVDSAVELSDPKGAKSWGYLPLNGCLHSSNNCTQPGSKGKQVSEPLLGNATGAVIKVQVDMDRRTLAFSVNGGDLVDAGVTLAPQVRPYVLMCFPGDKVQLESAE